MDKLRLYFSDIFDVGKDIIEKYGALNISLINDLPLFVDPFLLFSSNKTEYKILHDNIIKYLLFLKSKAETIAIDKNTMLKTWYIFPEIKQTWLGFSTRGNGGRGLGEEFANELYKGLNSLYSNFGNEHITKSQHIEKLCLISSRVGRDKISDFTVNLIKEYLLEYTEEFARNYIDPRYCKTFNIQKVYFDYETMVWQPKKFYLPCYNNDYVILTPKDMLTRDETFINRDDMIDNLDNIAIAVEDEILRFQLNNYFRQILKSKITKKEKQNAAIELINKNPIIIDYYIKLKEDNAEKAISLSHKFVKEVEQLFEYQLLNLVNKLKSLSNFYKINCSSYEESLKRVKYLKDVIEKNDGYKVFYLNGKPIKREKDLQVMYRLVWYATEFDVNREVNNGRGPVDFKVSNGAKDTTLIEFKLASSSKLKQNLIKQVEIYKEANNTKNAIIVIMYFTEEEYYKVIKILNELGLINRENVILIDARNDNKLSASVVKI
ncbi:hypothetical protein EDC21_12322 [Thermohydrogenium kirishiense]|nr:hypothetical protein EDC21_12322 [Thermohydrogenium kirishiense]